MSHEAAAGHSETLNSVLNSVLLEIPQWEEEHGEKDEKHREKLRHETDPDGSDFTNFL